MSSVECYDDEGKDDQSIASCCTPSHDDSVLNVSEDAQAQQNNSDDALADYECDLHANKSWNHYSPKSIHPKSQSESPYVGMQPVAQTKNPLSNTQQAIVSRSLCSCLRPASQLKNVHGEIQTAFSSKSQPTIFQPEPQSNIQRSELKLPSLLNHPRPEVQPTSHPKNIHADNTLISKLKNLKAVVHPQLQSKILKVRSQRKSLKAIVQPELQSKNLDLASQLKNLKAVVPPGLQSTVLHGDNQVVSQPDSKHTEARADSQNKNTNADSQTSHSQSLDASVSLETSLTANKIANMQQLAPPKNLQSDGQETPLAPLTKDLHTNMQQTSLCRSLEGDVQPSVQTQILDAAMQKAALLKHMQTYLQLSSSPKKQQTEQHLGSQAKSLNTDRPMELHNNNMQPAIRNNLQTEPKAPSEPQAIHPGMQPQMKCFQTDRQPVPPYISVKSSIQAVESYQRILTENAQRQCHLMAEHNEIIKEQCRLNVENNTLQAEIVKALNNSVRVASLLNTTMMNLSVANGSFCGQILGAQKACSQNWQNLASAFEGQDSQDLSGSGLTTEISSSDSDKSPSSSEDQRRPRPLKRTSSEKQRQAKRKK